MIHTICNQYNCALATIFRSNKRVEFDTCHNDTDFVIRSQEREILHAIEKYYKDKYDIFWNFRENLFGKCIITNVKQVVGKCQIPDFSGFETYYKEEFISRLRLIIDSTKNTDKIHQIKQLEYYPEIISDTESVDYEKYKELRDQIEKMRIS